MMKKRGLSDVIATVLIIMLTVGAVAMIFEFVIPFVKNNLEKAEVCNNIRGKITLGERTCLNSTNTMIQIELGGSNDVKGFLVSLSVIGGDSRLFEIRDGADLEGVSMYNGAGTVSIPGNGESKTYVFNMSSDHVSIAPIFEKKINCDKISESIVRC